MPIDFQPAQPRADWKGISPTTLAASDRPPGDFVINKSGSSVTIEGYLVNNRGVSRSAEELGLQAQVRKSAPADGRRWDASHLIAHMFGGHGLDNLVPMLQRLNVSYVGAVEKGIARELSATDVYTRVTVRLGDDGLPTAIVHECYTVADAGGVYLDKVFEAETKLNWEPQRTLASYLQQIGQQWKDWVGPDAPSGAQVH